MREALADGLLGKSCNRLEFRLSFLHRSDGDLFGPDEFRGGVTPSRSVWPNVIHREQLACLALAFNGRANVPELRFALRSSEGKATTSKCLMAAERSVRRSRACATDWASRIASLSRSEASSRCVVWRWRHLIRLIPEGLCPRKQFREVLRSTVSQMRFRRKAGLKKFRGNLSPEERAEHTPRAPLKR